MMKIYVTGGSGMVGSNLIKVAVERHHAKIFATIHKRQPEHAVPYDYGRVDMCDRSQVQQSVRAFRPDAIVHCAILSGQPLMHGERKHAWQSCLQKSEHIGPEDFVFAKPDGSTYNPDVLRKDVLYPALDRLRIPRVSRMCGFHAFRHLAGSIVNAQTGNLKLAQQLLGHSNLATTEDVYTHTFTESEREAAAAIEREIFPENAA